MHIEVYKKVFEMCKHVSPGELIHRLNMINIGLSISQLKIIHKCTYVQVELTCKSYFEKSLEWKSKHSGTFVFVIQCTHTCVRNTCTQSSRSIHKSVLFKAHCVGTPFNPSF